MRIPGCRCAVPRRCSRPGCAGPSPRPGMPAPSWPAGGGGGGGGGGRNTAGGGGRGGSGPPNVVVGDGDAVAVTEPPVQVRKPGVGVCQGNRKVLVRLVVDVVFDVYDDLRFGAIPGLTVDRRGGEVGVEEGCGGAKRT